MNEEDLSNLLDFIAGKSGPFIHSGKAGFHTHPGYDENQDGLHRLCEELERRRLVNRVIDEPGHACFVAVDNEYAHGKE